jgi:hypothetical protein
MLCRYLTRFNGFSHLSVEIDFGAGQSVGRVRQPPPDTRNYLIPYLILARRPKLAVSRWLFCLNQPLGKCAIIGKISDWQLR